ncbi:hypothetical protein BH18ACT17_BH18ACT17_10060 [soil metagenome]
MEIAGLEIDEPAWRADGDNWKLRLSWQEPAGGTIDHYELDRDGVTVADEIVRPGLSDVDVEPGTRYRYEVVGVDVDGDQTGSATASIRTREPKLSEARLEGAFVVRMTVERVSGTRNPVRGGAIVFSFDPACRTGPCPVRWTVRHARTDGMLRRDAGLYAADLRTPLFVRNCFGATIDEALDVRVRVSKAAPLRGQWRATKIEGTIAEVSSYRGCMTATIDWNVRGSLQS